MKKREWALFLIGMIFLWQCSSWVVNNPFILPSPFDVFLQMIQQCQEPVFIKSIIFTILRVFFSLFLSFIFALLCVFVFFKHSKARSYFEKLLLIVRSIPNVTWILLLLFWLQREAVVTMVSFLLLFPMIYENLKISLTRIFDTYKDVILTNPHPFFPLCFHVYLPLMKDSIQASLISASSMGFKVGIMAEILAQVSVGLGKQIQWSHLNAELASMIAWTIWLLLCAFIFDSIFRYCLKKIFD